MANMFAEYSYLIICSCLMLVQSYTVRKSRCEGSVCYYLYEANTTYVTWTASKDGCNDKGLEMLRIESNQTQATVEGLLQDLPQNTERHIWIGGKRSNHNTWRYMNGTEFHENVSTGDNEKVPYCVYVKLCKDVNPEYFADNCDENTSTSRIICEYKPVTIGHCASSDSPIGGRCYRKTQYGGETNKIDWYNGQTYCSQSDIQGDIAYSYLDNNTLINSIISLIDGRKTCILVWLGVRKRIWFWQTAANHDAIRLPIRYFNWSTKTETTSDCNCIYIDRNNGNKWVKESCNTVSLRYFLCMNESNTTSKSKSTIRSTTTVATTGEGLDSVMNNTPSTTQSGGSFPPAYIAAIISSMIVLALVIGLTIFFVRKKQRQKTKEHSYVNDSFHQVSTKQQEADELEYADVVVNNDDDDEVINPYGVTGTMNTSKNDVRHMETASGDLYALSSKQVNKLDKNNVNKNGKNREGLSAKPKKQRNKKPVDAKANGSGISGTDSEAHVSPSDGNVSGTGLKRTEHFNSPSGEVYATVTTG